MNEVTHNFKQLKEDRCPHGGQRLSLASAPWVLMLIVVMANFGCAEQEVPESRLDGKPINGEPGSGELSGGGSGENGGNGGNGGGIDHDPNKKGPEEKPTAISNIEDGFKLLDSSANKGRSYRIDVEFRHILDVNKPFLGAYEESTMTHSFKHAVDVVRWHNTADRSICDFQFDIAKADGGSRKVQDVRFAMCRGNPLIAQHSRYGINATCEIKAEVFLGTRDIDGFKNAFGARVFCRPHARIIGNTPTFFVHEFWFHPDSNHFLRKIRQLSLSFMDANGQPGSTDYKIPRPTYSGYKFSVELINFKNQSEPAPADEFDTAPPAMFASYSVEGAVKTPGVISSSSICQALDSDPTKLSSITLQSLYLMNEANDLQNIKDAHGAWEPNFPVGSGSFAFGAFRNRNLFGGMLEGGSPQIKYTRIRDTRYFKVTIDGSIRFMSKKGVATNGYHYATAKDFTPGFYCFGTIPKDFILWQSYFLPWTGHIP